MLLSVTMALAEDGKTTLAYSYWGTPEEATSTQAVLAAVTGVPLRARTSLRPVVTCPVYDCAAYDAVPMMDTAATLDADGSVTLFIVNRDLREDISLTVDLRAFGALREAEHSVLHHDDINAINTADAPDAVSPAPGKPGSWDNGKSTVRVPFLSWNVIRLQPV